MVIMSLIAPFITFLVLLKYGCSGTFIIFLSIIVGFALYRSIAQEYVEIYPNTCINMSTNYKISIFSMSYLLFMQSHSISDV